MVLMSTPVSNTYIIFLVVMHALRFVSLDGITSWRQFFATLGVKVKSQLVHCMNCCSVFGDLDQVRIGF